MLSQKNSEELQETIGSAFGRLLNAIVKYKLVLETDSPLLLAKKHGATLYDRFKEVMFTVQNFWLNSLSLKDTDNEF